MNISKLELSKTVFKKTGIALYQCQQVIDSMLFDVMPDFLITGMRIELRGFATFYPKKRKARKMWDKYNRNFRQLPERNTVTAVISPNLSMEKSQHGNP